MNVIGWVIKWTCGLALLITAFIIIAGAIILLKVTIGLNAPAVKMYQDTFNASDNSREYKSDIEIVPPVIAKDLKKTTVSDIYNNPKLPPKKN
tara:strand:+ start:1310 stop:1588 length:279 start_codon:yes stop_codon:yes gene_type:complete